MVEIGTRRRYDATKAEVDWGNAALDVITVSNALVSARAQLNRTLGLAEYPSYAVLPDLMPPRTDLSVSNLMEQARQNDPSLAVLHAKARAASAYVDQTIADLYPSLSLGADLSESGRDFPMTWNFSWALRATQNLFDGHKKTDRIRAAVTDLRSARARVADAEQELFLNLVNAVAQFKSARKRREIAELVERQAAENRDIVNEQYRVGVSSAIERTDAQVAVTQAQADAVRARYDEQAAEARLARLTGAPVGAEATPPPAAAP
jgi:outer membrane protein TolC